MQNNFLSLLFIRTGLLPVLLFCDTAFMPLPFRTLSDIFYIVLRFCAANISLFCYLTLQHKRTRTHDWMSIANLPPTCELSSNVHYTDIIYLYARVLSFIYTCAYKYIISNGDVIFNYVTMRNNPLSQCDSGRMCECACIACLNILYNLTKICGIFKFSANQLAILERNSAH